MTISRCYLSITVASQRKVNSATQKHWVQLDLADSREDYMIHLELEIHLA